MSQLRWFCLWVGLPVLLGLAVRDAAAQEAAQVEVFGGYSYLRTDDNFPNSSIAIARNLHGGSGSLTFNLTRWFGVAAEAGGHYGRASLTLPGRDKAEAANRAFALHCGPRFAWRNQSRITPFGRVLFGLAHGEADVAGFHKTSTPRIKSTGFSVVAGGGFDVRLNQRLAVRPLMVDYLSSRYDTGTLNHLRMSTGLVIHFGKR